MARPNRPKDYLDNKNLLREILDSQEKLSAFPEEEWPERVSECLTPELITMIVTLVDKNATSYRWRGYSWIEDMKAEAYMNLCRVALKFNLEKAVASGNPPNPFAYYTQIVNRVFLTYIEREKKQGKIRDEIIEMSDTDLLPSMARQHEGETSQSGQDLDGTKTVENDPMKRRRRKKMKDIDKTNKMTDGEYKRWLDAKRAEFHAKKS